jgi:hypothetical protein
MAYPLQGEPWYVLAHALALRVCDQSEAVGVEQDCERHASLDSVTSARLTPQDEVLAFEIAWHTDQYLGVAAQGPDCFRGSAPQVRLLDREMVRWTDLKSRNRGSQLTYSIFGQAARPRSAKRGKCIRFYLRILPIS